MRLPKDKKRILNKILKHKDTPESVFLFVDNFCNTAHTGVVKPLKLLPQEKRHIAHCMNNDLTLTLMPRDGGKSFDIGIICLYDVYIQVNQTGALISLGQTHTNRIIEEMNKTIDVSPYLKDVYEKKFKQKHTRALMGPNGSKIIAYPGMQKSVMGDHPRKIWVDEATAEIKNITDRVKIDSFYSEVLMPSQQGITQMIKPQLHITSFWAYNQGFVSGIYTRAKQGIKEGLDYSVLEIPWYDCGDVFTEESIQKIKEELIMSGGSEDDLYIFYGGKGFLPVSSDTIDPVSIDACMIPKRMFHPDLPVFLGVDLGKIQHDTAITCWQINTQEKIPRYMLIDEWYKNKFSYEIVNDKIEEFMGKYQNTEAIVLDNTNEQGVLDNLRDGRGVFIAEGVDFHGGRRPIIFHNIKNLVETHRLMIPEQFHEFKKALKDANLGAHLPDPFASAGVILYKIVKKPLYSQKPTKAGYITEEERTGISNFNNSMFSQFLSGDSPISSF